ncbi:Ssb-c31a [Drosophila busckii]|uniref:Ssb-c31a n=1 Tax=Drosophila busckii TaxID=30019 RepID=A0A0M5IW01_DROBS|nr:RNA polymerase II transcriptional coactivator [Drosophila busckii]ALC38206.1 Ssb-c31a [Drosophila busckii]
MPKIKKKQESSSADSDSGPEDRNPPASKKAKANAGSAGAAKSNVADSGDGENVWTLEGMRQVRINEFRNVKRVDIREFYQKDGKTLPGKKGISLSATQWRKLLDMADEITRALEA